MRRVQSDSNIYKKTVPINATGTTTNQTNLNQKTLSQLRAHLSVTYRRAYNYKQNFKAIEFAAAAILDDAEGSGLGNNKKEEIKNNALALFKNTKVMSEIESRKLLIIQNVCRDFTEKLEKISRTNSFEDQDFASEFNNKISDIDNKINMLLTQITISEDVDFKQNAIEKLYGYYNDKITYFKEYADNITNEICAVLRNFPDVELREQIMTKLHEVPKHLWEIAHSNLKFFIERDFKPCIKSTFNVARSFDSEIFPLIKNKTVSQPGAEIEYNKAISTLVDNIRATEQSIIQLSSLVPKYKSSLEEIVSRL